LASAIVVWKYVIEEFCKKFGDVLLRYAVQVIAAPLREWPSVVADRSRYGHHAASRMPLRKTL
jgi:hypothetical protein